MKKQKTKTKPKQEKKSRQGYKEDTYQKIDSFIDKQKGEWFFASDLKKHLHNGRTDIGGGSFLRHLIETFGLERKEEGRRVLLRARK